MEPRKISMYREEAIDSLVQCLRNTDFPRSQLLAAETIMCLPGKFSSSGRPLTRSSLLKLARVKERHRQSQDLTTVRGGEPEDQMVRWPFTVHLNSMSEFCGASSLSEFCRKRPRLSRNGRGRRRTRW